MELDDAASDAFDGLLSPAPAKIRVSKFQPKPRIKPKKAAAAAAASNPSNGPEASSASKMEDDILATSGVVEAAGASNIGSSSKGPMDDLSQVDEAQEPVDANEELTHEVGCDLDKQEDEAMPSLAGVEPNDDILLQPSETEAVKKVGKFKPKRRSQPKNHETISQPKEKKAKSVSFSLPDAVESAAAPVVAHADPQPSFPQMMDDEDKIPHSTSGISDDVDFQLDHENARKEELANLSGLESFDCILSESTSVTGKTAPEFRPKPCTKTRTVKSSTSDNTNGAKDSTSSQWDALPMEIESLEDLDICTENFANEQTESIQMHSVDAGSPQGDAVFETIGTAFESGLCETVDTALESNNYIGGKTKVSAVSEDTGNEGQTRDDDEQTEDRLEDRSKSKGFEESDGGKSSRKLRKRTAACQPDVGISESLDVANSGNSRMGKGQSGDVHMCEDMPKQKKQPKRSKRQMTDAVKPTKRCRNASKEPDSVEAEPPKKRFPHGTRRKRRQVDKDVLEKYDDGGDPRHFKIEQLILLGEHIEKNPIEEDAPSTNDQSNTESYYDDNFHERDPYSHENVELERRNTLRNSQKINYMTHMAKPQRAKWSKSETELLYEAIRQFGTDFGMIVQLFPNRTREQVKSKFKLEERRHPLEIRDAMSHRSGDHSHYEKVIQVLQAQAKDESIHDGENGDPTTVSHDAANGNEEQGDRPEREDEADEGFESVDGITDYNEYESVDSYPQDEYDETY